MQRVLFHASFRLETSLSLLKTSVSGYRWKCHPVHNFEIPEVLTNQHLRPQGGEKKTAYLNCSSLLQQDSHSMNYKNYFEHRAQWSMGWSRTSLSWQSISRGTRGNIHNMLVVLMLWLTSVERLSSSHLSYARAAIGTRTISYSEAKSSVLPLITSPCGFGSLLSSWRRISPSLLINRQIQTHAQLEPGWRRGYWPLQLYLNRSLDRSLAQTDAKRGQNGRGSPFLF